MLRSQLRGHIACLLVDGIVLGELVGTLRAARSQLVAVLIEAGFDLGVIESALGQLAGDVAFLNPASDERILDLGGAARQLGGLLKSVKELMAERVERAVAGALADDVGVDEYGGPFSLLELHAADVVAELFGHLRIGTVEDINVPELASNQSLQIHQRRGSIHTVLITHPLKECLGSRVLLGINEAAQVACTGFLSGSSGELLVHPATESTGCTLNTARTEACSGPLFTTGQIAQACTNGCAFNTSSDTPQ